MMTIQEFNKRQSYVFTHGWHETARPLSEYMAAFKLTIDNIRRLKNKKLLLVGGGNSPIQKTLNRLHINCDVTNVDPYVSSSSDTARSVLVQDFVTTDFVNEFDECWALFSLPLYSPNTFHGACFYARAAISLKPGGILRVGGLPQYTNGALLAEHINRSDMDILESRVKDLLVSPTADLEKYELKLKYKLAYSVLPKSKRKPFKPNMSKINSYHGNDICEIYNYNPKLEPEARYSQRWAAPTDLSEKSDCNTYLQKQCEHLFSEHMNLFR